MSRIFLSYSSDAAVQAGALRDWLNANGWNDVVPKAEPPEGAGAGDSGRGALGEYATRCDAVLFLVSRNWLASQDCRDEYDLARKLDKAVFIAPTESLSPEELHVLHPRSDRVFPLHAEETANLDHEGKSITFSVEGLEKLKAGLAQVAVDARFFDWPPPGDPGRAPYRGFDAFETADAGVFFGREEPLIEALDALRGLVEAPKPRLFVVLGPPGSGISSFLRAGLWPRLERDSRYFYPLPVVRPGAAAISGADGLVPALARATEKVGAESSAAKIREALASGSDALRSLFKDIAGRAAIGPKPPTLVVGIDRAEELFRAEGAGESDRLLKTLGELAAVDAPAVLVVFALRSVSYDDLARASPLEGMERKIFPLEAMPIDGFRAAVERPAQRVVQAGGALEIDPDLTQALLDDVEASGGDALPLFSF
ncbi:MAG TPA: TIR and AAA domain-containing protein, partial [Methylocystis sp.]|nr:TIR and AAA domain-containing protein [Methylocystis sp.]